MPSSKPVTLYRGWPGGNKHVWSPFVVKLEARLRFAGVPYTTEAGSRNTAPKGKIPYVECDGESFGDSTLIAARLVDSGVLPDINARLLPDAKAHDHALRALLEDKLYFYHVRFPVARSFRD